MQTEGGIDKRKQNIKGKIKEKKANVFVQRVMTFRR